METTQETTKEYRNRIQKHIDGIRSFIMRPRVDIDVLCFCLTLIFCVFILTATMIEITKWEQAVEYAKLTCTENNV